MDWPFIESIWLRDRGLYHSSTSLTFMHSLRVCKFVHRFLPLSRHCMATAMKIKMMQMEQKE